MSNVRIRVRGTAILPNTLCRVVRILALYSEGLGCEYVPCYFGWVPDISPKSLQDKSEQHLIFGNERLLPDPSEVIVHNDLTARRYIYVIHSSASQANLQWRHLKLETLYEAT